MNLLPHKLVIAGGRQSGKTYRLIDIAIDEAARENRTVYWQGWTREYTHDAWRRTCDRAEELVPDEIVRSYATNGKERIVFRGGGAIWFNSQLPRGLGVDTHICDDADQGEPVIDGCSRFYKAVLI